VLCKLLGGVTLKTSIGCLIDTETTGLTPGMDEIIEFAAILFSFNQETGEILEVIEEHTYLREPLSPAAIQNYDVAFRIHGIPFKKVKGKKFDDDVIKGIFSRADILIAHNASFDRSFLYHMYPEVNNHKWHCSMRHIAWKDYGHANKKLITLLKDHGIATDQSHRALDDIMLLLELLKRKNPHGDYYLKEILSHRPMRKYQPKETNFKRSDTYIFTQERTATQTNTLTQPRTFTQPKTPVQSMIATTEEKSKQWDNPIVRLFYSKFVILFLITFLGIANLLLSLVYGWIYFIVSEFITYLLYKALTNKRKEMLRLKSKHG
jgi:DNA polymerase-3 subunit epsilon